MNCSESLLVTRRTLFVPEVAVDVVALCSKSTEAFAHSHSQVLHRSTGKTEKGIAPELSDRLLEMICLDLINKFKSKFAPERLS